DWCKGLSSSLPNLEVLSLSSCQLSGPLKDSLENLKSLSVIRLDYNNLSAPIPNFFANLKNLTVMKLASCNLIGTFPEKVLQLQSLQTLDLALNNNLSGSLPDFPINGSLQSLVLSNTNLSGAIPESIGNLKNLSRINLRQSNFSGRIPKSLEKLTHLSYIDFNSSIVSHLPKLYALNLASCNLQKFPNLQNHSTLMYVDLSDNNIPGEIPNWIWEVGNGGLLYMNVSHNQLTGLEEPYTFPINLTCLDLHSNNLSGVIHVPPIMTTYIDYSNNR
nr:hypothetical protein [Tanacetum cinerariifolium]